MVIKCFNCGVDMVESRFTPVGQLPPLEKYPVSIYVYHPTADCPVSDYVIQVGYKA